MSKVEFTKGQGTGNDFVLILDLDGSKEITPAQVAKICDRHFGVGADGLIRIVPSHLIPEGAAALEEEQSAYWFMDYRNADGSVAEMCGNGVRVFARYLTEKGLVDLPESQVLHIGTRAGVRDIQKNKAGFAVDMGRWKPDTQEVLVSARGLDVPRPSQGINVGNPHLVVALASSEELSSLDLSTAPSLEPAPEPVDC